jgi:predicted amidophosphoribosyltransferase
MAGPRSDGGILIVTRDDGKVREYKTATCKHCQSIIVFGAQQDEGGFCRSCMSLVCGRCADDGRCVTFEEKIRREETAFARRQALSRMLGI